MLLIVLFWFGVVT